MREAAARECPVGYRSSAEFRAPVMDGGPRGTRVESTRCSTRGMLRMHWVVRNMHDKVKAARQSRSGDATLVESHTLTWGGSSPVS